MHDPVRRRKAARSGRQTGFAVYIPAEVARAAGWPDTAELPYYRTWGTRRGVVLLRFYREP